MIEIGIFVMWLLTLATLSNLGRNIANGLYAVSAQIGHAYCELTEWRRDLKNALEPDQGCECDCHEEES